MSHIMPSDLDKLEGDAKRSAMKQVANMLQRPDQLEKIDQYKRRIARKKASVETMLKTAMQSQLDGVRNGLNQLQSGLNDIKEIKNSMWEVHSTYKSIEELQTVLHDVRKESSRHRQLGAAVENLKHIFTVPETVKKTQDYINDGKLLLAHKCLTDLEASRDELLLEVHKQTSASITDRNMINVYFHDVQKLSDDLGKQLWLVLQRTLSTVRREPTIIVTVLRIIEREQRNDEAVLKREQTSGFLPPGRPKRWKEKCFDVLKNSVVQKIEGSQLETRDLDKMWLVRHLELIRQHVVEDLQVANSLCQPCFPPKYNIVKKYVAIYHQVIKDHIQDLISQELQGNEVVSLLSWLQAYNGPDMMGNPLLKIETLTLEPLTDKATHDKLQKQYLETMRNNLQEWMRNSLNSDIKDWRGDFGAEQDADGFFNTPLPVIIVQMFEQNIQVASTIHDELAMHVLNMCVDEMLSFSKPLGAELRTFKLEHFEDRSKPRYYPHYMIANINNCGSIMDFIDGLIHKFSKGDLDDTIVNEPYQRMCKTFESIAREGCNYLLDEVFLDLNKLTENILTRGWLGSSEICDTIQITMEDYCQDFYHLKKVYFDYLLGKAQEKIIVQYVKAFTSDKKRMSFKNLEERRLAAEKVEKEAQQYQSLFVKLTNMEDVAKSPWIVLPSLAEVVRLKDPALLGLEISTIVARFSEARVEQLVNLLQYRGDINKGESRQLVEESIGGEKPTRTEGIFTLALSS